MNERIKELAEQCWDKRPEGQLHFDNEKFAELIVRECAKRVDYWESRQGEHCDDLIKHFGVAQSDIEAAERIHSDKGYSIGTPEAQEAFERKRGYKL